MMNLNILKYLASTQHILLCRRLLYNKYSNKVDKNKHIYKNTTSFQEDILSTAVQNNSVQTVEEWTVLKNSVLEKGRDITNVNFDVKILNSCIVHKNFIAAKSFLNFIQAQNLKPNDATLGKFMRLYYVCFNNNECIKSEENSIINIYNEFKKSYPLIPSILAENIIHGLSVTRDWKECLKLLDTVKENEKPSASTYSAVILAAFNNSENELGWNLLREMIRIPRLPVPVVYNTWLNKPANEANVGSNVRLLLSYLEDNDIYPSKEVTDNLLDVLRPLSYHGTYTSVSHRGVCQHCKQTLQKIQVNSDNFEKLRNAFMDKVIIGKNIFNKTTPDELNNFKQFIKRMGPCDIVIDGLNVAYSAGVKKPPIVYAKLLSNVVTHFRRNSKTMLVLGRKHMNKWPKDYMNYIAANTELFLAENISHDDPFLLYATMSSGLGTNFLSRDFMRGHMYLLMDENMKRLYRRWQQLHQYSLIYAEANGRVHLKPPFPYLTTVQTSQDGWHIPYIQEHLPNPPFTLEPPKQWLCICKTS